MMSDSCSRRQAQRSRRLVLSFHGEFLAIVFVDLGSFGFAERFGGIFKDLKDRFAVVPASVFELCATIEMRKAQGERECVPRCQGRCGSQS